MNESVKEVLLSLAPYIAGLVGSGFLSAIATKIIYCFIEKKLSQVAPTEEYKALQNEIKEIKELLANTQKEVLQIRGKRK